jgi:membrane-associated protease RseP (regulator of RpoE activity)
MKRWSGYLVSFVTFCLAFFSCTLAGYGWISGNLLFPFSEINLEKVVIGTPYAICLLGILLVHEMGHYIASKLYRIKVSLPTFIPMWFPGLISIGTMGAFIRIKEAIISRKQYFDVGISGPLAGIAMAMIFLIFGIINLPGLAYLFEIHPEYQSYGTDYPTYIANQGEPVFSIGYNLLFYLLETWIRPINPTYPVLAELIHYPWLFGVYLSCFFTALNLLPIGQLDGGHITFACFGEKWHNYIGLATMNLLAFAGGFGLFGLPFSSEEYIWVVAYSFGLSYLFQPFYLDRVSALINGVALLLVQLILNTWVIDFSGFGGWLFFGFFVRAFLGVKHPDVPDQRSVGNFRVYLALLSLFFFIIMFAPSPFALKG